MPRIHLSLPPEQYAEFFTAEQVGRLDALGTVTRDDPGKRCTATELLAYDVVVTGWGSPALPGVPPESSALRLVAHAAGSVRHVVPAALLEHGVQVTQSAAAMADAVAEFALTLCLNLLRNVHTYDRAMYTAADWSSREWGGLGGELPAQRIGVVGASRTGRSFVRMVRALGAAVTVFDPYLSAADAASLGVTRVDLATLLANSDVVVVHAPVTAETTGMLGAAELALIPDGGILVNTARSAVLDEKALTAELVSGRLRAGLDVFDVEPLPAGHPLLRLPNVIVTPHEAGASVQSREAQGRIAVDEIERFLTGQPLRHEVTRDRYDHLA
ncbi:hydroxyacid dehydrogenase [Actinocatenispora rupis]|uniref:Dehydrogenase n=1 Tax=Actinocatenispora rupis TaxID=519421 RepID=A0A8J3J2K7_9ACTN|nr:hydroxyacid dehydrogenase [Actinocatenispora rupis]GID10832.1 dehydrogenase [Actinocatenispora rupis]